MKRRARSFLSERRRPWSSSAVTRRWPSRAVVAFAILSAACASPGCLVLSLQMAQVGSAFFELDNLLSWEMVWAVQLASLGVVGSAGLLLLGAPARAAWISRAWWGTSAALSLVWLVVNASWLGWAVDEFCARTQEEVGQLGVVMAIALSIPSAMVALLAVALGEWWRRVLAREEGEGLRAGRARPERVSR